MFPTMIGATAVGAVSVAAIFIALFGSPVDEISALRVSDGCASENAPVSDHLLVGRGQFPTFATRESSSGDGPTAHPSSYRTCPPGILLTVITT